MTTHQLLLDSSGNYEQDEVLPEYVSHLHSTRENFDQRKRQDVLETRLTTLYIF